jgi:hypothetical protein
MSMENFEGTLVGVLNEGSVVGIAVHLTDGKLRKFWGDHRPMWNILEGRKMACRVLIHYESETDWTIEFPDEEK